MTTINLKDFYYWYTQDQFIEVSDEVAEVTCSGGLKGMVFHGKNRSDRPGSGRHVPGSGG